MKLPVKPTETKSGKGKVVDDHGFSVCNTGGGSYAEQRKVAFKIANALNYHARLVEALRNCVDGWQKSEDVFTPMQEARALLAELDNLENGS